MSEIEVLDWKGLSTFYYKNLVKKKEPGDGNCFFHCIADSFYLPYQTGKVNRSEFTKKMRLQLSLLLESKNDRGVMWYKTLSRGKLEELSQNLPELSLDNMKKHLGSNAFVDNRFNEFISNVFNKDIYILNQDTKDVYKAGVEGNLLYRNRESIVIIWCNQNHFDLVGIIEENRIRTLFDPNHPLIQKIKERLNN